MDAISLDPDVGDSIHQVLHLHDLDEISLVGKAPSLKGPLDLPEDLFFVAQRLQLGVMKEQHPLDVVTDCEHCYEV